MFNVVGTVSVGLGSGLRKGIEHVPERFRDAVSKFLEFLREKFGERLVSVVVYGSVARGTFKEDSDVDILVVCEGFPKKIPKRIDLFVDKTFEIAVEKGVRISVMPLSVDEAKCNQPIYLDMAYEGIILHDKDGFIEDVLKKLRKKLEEMGAERVKYGRWYLWKLKRNIEVGEVIRI